MQYVLPIYHEGFVADEEIFFDGLLFPTDTIISSVSLSVREAPVGANLTIDILKGGIEQSKIITLTAGSTYETTNIAATFATTERFGLKVKSAGSSVEGSGVSIVLTLAPTSTVTDLTTYLLPIYHEGFAGDEETFFDGLFFPTRSSVSKVILMAREAPTGADLTFDILKDGTEQSATITLTAGSTYETTDITDVTFEASERFGLKTKSIGSSIEGSGISIYLVVTAGVTSATRLTTLDNVKSYMGITDTTDDTILDMLINRVSAWIENYCNRVFGNAIYDQLYDGNNSVSMVVKNAPVTAFATLEIDGEEVLTGDYFWYDYGEVILESGRYGTKRQSIHCVYTAGYTVIPFEVEDVAIKLTAMTFYGKGKDRLGISSKTLGREGSVTYSNTAIPSEVRHVLDSFKFINIGASRAK